MALVRPASLHTIYSTKFGKETAFFKASILLTPHEKKGSRDAVNIIKNAFFRAFFLPYTFYRQVFLPAGMDFDLFLLFSIPPDVFPRHSRERQRLKKTPGFAQAEKKG
jgi:hypothetical protein